MSSHEQVFETMVKPSKTNTYVHSQFYTYFYMYIYRCIHRYIDTTWIDR